MAQKSKLTDLSSSCEILLSSAAPFSTIDVALKVQAELGTTMPAMAAAAGIIGHQHKEQASIAEHKVSRNLRVAVVWLSWSLGHDVSGSKS
jgi:hypothetical protein